MVDLLVGMGEFQSQETTEAEERVCLRGQCVAVPVSSSGAVQAVAACAISDGQRDRQSRFPPRGVGDCGAEETWTKTGLRGPCLWGLLAKEKKPMLIIIIIMTMTDIRGHFGSSRCWTLAPQRLEPRWNLIVGQSCATSGYG